MAQQIHLAAIVASEGRLMLVRPRPDAPWELPGGPLLPEHDDAEAGMDAHLARFGVTAPAIDEDFVDTLYLPGDDGYVVYNLYAASEWRGEPSVPPGVGLGWFAPAELEAIPMRAGVRDAVLTAFGLREPVDTTAEMLASLQSAFGGDPRVASPVETKASGGRDRDTFLQAIEAHGRGEIAPGLELDGRTKALEAIAILAATGRCDDLGAFAERALDDGASPRDLVETLRLVAHVAGMPAAAAAWPVVAGALRSRGIAIPGDAP